MIRFHSNEKRDLSRIHYARAGSYYYLTEDYFKRILKLTSIFSGDMTMITDMSFYVHLLQDGKPIRYHYYGDVGSLRLINTALYADVTLTGRDLFRFRGCGGSGIMLELASNMEGRGAAALDSIARLKDGSWEGVFGKHGYLRFVPLCGRVEVEAPYDPERERYACLRVSFLPDESGCFEVACHQYAERFDPPASYPSFEEERQENIRSYEAFFGNYKGLPMEEYGQMIEDTVYVTWSHILKPGGFVKTPMIMHHYNAIVGAMSWQQSYNGMALLGNPAEGFRLIESMFLYQNPVNGALPGSVSTGGLGDGILQPPLQGFALNLLVRRCGEDFITPAMAERLLGPFTRWIDFWVQCRTTGRGDDVIAINNPNESGWDDSSNYAVGFPVSNADTLALLIESMYACSTLARRAGRPAEEADWKRRADALLHTLVTEFWNGERFVTRLNGEIVPSQSLACYIPLMLGDKLPAEIVDKCAEVLTEEGNFLSCMGLCSESMRSPLCHWGWHFVLGRVIAPQQMYITVGLWLAGKKEEARLIARRWMDTVAEKGPRLGFAPYDEYPDGRPAEMNMEPDAGDGWSWCGWGACNTMTMLQVIFGTEE